MIKEKETAAGTAFSEGRNFMAEFRTEAVGFFLPCGVMRFLKDLDERMYVLETNCIMYSPQNVEPTKQFFLSLSLLSCLRKVVLTQICPVAE